MSALERLAARVLLGVLLVLAAWFGVRHYGAQQRQAGWDAAVAERPDVSTMASDEVQKLIDDTLDHAADLIKVVLGHLRQTGAQALQLLAGNLGRVAAQACHGRGHLAHALLRAERVHLFGHDLLGAAQHDADQR